MIYTVNERGLLHAGVWRELAWRAWLAECREALLRREKGTLVESSLPIGTGRTRMHVHMHLKQHTAWHVTFNGTPVEEIRYYIQHRRYYTESGSAVPCTLSAAGLPLHEIPRDAEKEGLRKESYTDVACVIDRLHTTTHWTRG